ncbi:MAG: hypothetical protein ABWZ90_02575 [Acidimicrobiales bacterium]
MSRPTSFRSALASLGVAAVAGLLSTSCGSEAPAAAETPDPVFALDRDITASIEVPDPDRTDVAPAPDLRILLQTLLAEHSELAIQTMRAVIDETPDLDALREAITVNTDALTEAIGLVYGPSVARAFDQLWTQHIELFAAYAGALGDGDDDAAAEARDQLEDYALDFSSFCSTATGGAAPVALVDGLFHDHVRQLLGQADEWAGGDRAAAYASQAEAHAHAAAIAAVLAGAISAQQPDAFPGDSASDLIEALAERRTVVTAYAIGQMAVAKAEILDVGDVAQAQALAEDATEAMTTLAPPPDPDALADLVAEYRAALENRDFTAVEAARVELDTLAHELAVGRPLQGQLGRRLVAGI